MVPLTGGRGTAVIDEEDRDLLGVRWHRSSRGDAYRYVGEGLARTTVRLHVVVARRAFGAVPRGVQVGHANGDRLDCRRGNLRLARPTGRLVRARRRAQGVVATVYKGVAFHKPSGTWRAELRHKGVYLHLGHFDDASEAARAYDAKARDLYGESARCNFPAEGTLIRRRDVPPL